jgi:hypothetical protein
MSYTIVYSKYNGLPGSTDNYDYLSGAESPILPDVDLYNSFNFEVKSTSAEVAAPPTQTTGAGRNGIKYNNRSNYNTRGYRYGSSSSRPSGAYVGIHVARIPTEMRWVDTGGPNGDGIAQNERGDWFNRDVLSKADGRGSGVAFVQNPTPAGNIAFSFITSVDADGVTDAATFTVPDWNTLSIQGSYNGGVFCYNEFGYLDEDPNTYGNKDYTSQTFEVNSLYELPDKFDNLYKFIPDQREDTTLTFQIEVDWQLHISFGIWAGFINSDNQDKILERMGYSSATQTGTDVHTITQVINNNTGDWPKILEEILNERQRSQDEQNERLGQTFPTTDIEVTSPTVVKVEDKELTPEQNLYNQQIETSNFTQYKIKVDTLP